MPPIRAHLLAAGTALVVAWAVFGNPVLAYVGVMDSPHDFSARAPAVARGGSCSACHIPHRAAESLLLWPRTLVPYRNAFQDYDGSPPTQKNYLGSPLTVQCYDCHDYYGTGTPSTTIESTPNPSLDNFVTLDHRPQNIVSGFTNASGGGGGNMTEDPFGGAVPGYWETSPPGGSASWGVNALAPLSGTGGHYFKTDPTTSPTDGYKQGDKLPCRDCHDPHAWNSGGNWQAFIRRTWPTSKIRTRLGLTDPPGTSGNSYASSLMANPVVGPQQRSSPESRKLCIACHGTGDDNNAKTPDMWAVQFHDIRGEYDAQVATNDNITQTPEGVDEHLNSSTVACVACHNHNSVEVNCASCHSYPGLDNTASGKQMSAGHWAHVGKPGVGGTNNSMGYKCQVCHFGYGSSHNGNNISAGASWASYNPAKVDIRFDNTLNPGSATYNGQNAGTATAPGVGGTGVCAGLYCHGDNPAKNLMWEGAAKQPAWNGTVACGACHKVDSTFRQGNHAVHLNNTGANARGPGGIDAFSPAGNCSDGTSTGCHTAYGKSPTTTHARGTADFRVGPSDGAWIGLNGTFVCQNCHTMHSPAVYDNGAHVIPLFIADTSEFAKYNWSDNNSRLPCVSCHNSDRAFTKTDASDPNGRAPNIANYWNASGHGYPGLPVDNTDTTTVSGNVNQILPLPCSSCHDTNSRHFGNTTATGNAWRLVSWSRYTTDGGLDQFCAFQCHAGAYSGPDNCLKPGLPPDHFWVEALCPRDTATGKQSSDTHGTSMDVVVAGKTQRPDYATYRMPFNDNVKVTTSSNRDYFLCVTCHDPHGTGPGAAASWGRSFAGDNDNTLGNLHMLRYDRSADLCKKCHI